MTQTCSPCRQRKVKCDGLLPQCSQCTKARKPLQCEYGTSGLLGAYKGPALQKGEACFPCRKKKKRCGGERPYCSGCMAAGKEAECEYEELITREEARVLQQHNQHLQQQNEGLQSTNNSLQQEILRLQQQLAGYKTSSTSAMVRPSDTSKFPEEHLPSLVSTAAPTWPVCEVPAYWGQVPLGAPSPTDSLGFQAQLPGPDMTNMFVGFELLSPMVDKPLLPRTLPFNDEMLAIYRDTFITHYDQLGLSLRPAKVDALRRGDISGQFAAPVLVFLAQLAGCRLWREHFRSTADRESEYILSTLLFDALDATTCLVTRLQVHTTLTIHFLIKLDMDKGAQQLQMAAKLVEENSSTFLSPPIAGADGSHEYLAEHISALCQLVYLDKAAQIVLHGPPMLQEWFERGYEDLLCALSPFIAKNNFPVLRARSIGLLQRALQLSSDYEAAKPDYRHIGKLATVRLECVQVQTAVRGHIQGLSQLAESIHAHGSVGNMLALKLCLIISMTAAATLQSVCSDEDLRAMRFCSDTIEEIVRLTKGFKDGDYIYLDPILSTCWSITAEIIKKKQRWMSLESCVAEHWQVAIGVMIESAKKLGRALPFTVGSIQDMEHLVGNGVSFPES
ncbi:hypothetical protein CERSUDRAFT_113705 [Gelatoporia subvermispora B]|uniref:Zn(2)-C6 fungal-type domain-containing protein n=1 Tax=Ceriporiopsis subvermispora (strain B) TaxID=914234 RepID=M2RIB1_CERS8|nr:hypothetical protein CERSUDRAFT_113705 [Gelatoporia subvermispora B]